MYKIIIYLLIFLAVIAGITALQVYLSKLENKWAGLIIPIVLFVISILVIAFYVMPNTVVDTGVHADEVTNASSTAPVLVSLIAFFILMNIPTFISMLIYFVCRKSKTKKKQLDKLNIQDLN